MELTLESVVVERPGFRLGPVDRRLGPGLWRLPGPNGAGKTTLLRAIAGDLHPRSGVVRLDGRDVHREDLVRARIGFTPVEPELPDFLTATEAWQMLAALREGPFPPTLQRARAFGLDPGVRLGACSAGMRHKAEILGALAGEPDLLLLDEPFASLDVAAAEVLSGWLAEWRRSRIVLIAHHGVLNPTPDGEVW